ncbi:zinc metalloproteinase nas-13-like [Mizuhopecten yessoensis]|uniref:Metalloendopeptidase n=1 Tax=Mizuhopecten yessoensis TaxID=6573 RepID=A0A210PQU2_MIZYE|nr:zinc metalloproteinase nas-13-like [Mizuhopecten yessoensis]OWF38855.1 Zinc metalloproteinase nas-14 [Mizuhopecten yessoensis]
MKNLTLMRTVLVYLLLWLHIGTTIGQLPTQSSPALRRLLSRLVTDVDSLFKIVKLFKSLNHNSASSSRTNQDIVPIDQIIEEAEDPAASIKAEPSYIEKENAFKLEGDIMMTVDQFTDMQTHISFDLLEDAVAMMLNTTDRITSVQTLMNEISAGARSGRPSSRVKRAARRDPNRLWPDAVMPVRIASSGFSAFDRWTIQRAMMRISEQTCICFRIIDNEVADSGIPHVQIVDGSGCSSYVGVTTRSRGRQNSQDLTLNSKCRTFRVATHELLHALGLFHEQSRPDRDFFVKINSSNIRSGMERNFQKFSRRTINSRGIPYDYTSIMHYSNRAFSKDGTFTIEPIPAINRFWYLNIIGRSTAMSEGDVQALRLMYNCPSTPSTQPTCADYPYMFPY